MKESVFSNDKVYTVETNGYSSDGSAVARLDGFIVFIKGGISGEKYNIRLTDISKNYARAQIVDILESADSRIIPNCDSYPDCGGCDLRHMTYEEELDFKCRKVNNALQRLGEVDVQIGEVFPSPQTEFYRNNSQYKVQKLNNQSIFGFYKSSSHTVIPCNKCKIQPPEFNEIASTLCNFIGNALEEIVVRKAFSTGELLCAVKTKYDIDVKGAVCELSEKAPQLKGIISFKADKSGKYSKKVLYGIDYIEDTLCGKRFRISCNTFYQINPFQTENLYNKAIEFALDGNETIGNALDLYCGIGTIGISASDYADSIIGIDIVNESILNAKTNAALNNLNNTAFYCGDAKKEVEKLKKKGYHPDVIFTDPPRSGMDGKTIDLITDMSPSRIVYVSCNPATMARDLKKLKDREYNIKSLTAFDMFPRTEHVETVVLLSRKAPDDTIEVDLDLDELDITSAESKATYQEIKDYVLKEFGLKVSTLYISQIKRKCGIDVGEHYNISQKENPKVPQCPKDKEDAIRTALEYFAMI